MLHCSIERELRASALPPKSSEILSLLVFQSSTAQASRRAKTQTVGVHASGRCRCESEIENLILTQIYRQETGTVNWTETRIVNSAGIPKLGVLQTLQSMERAQRLGGKIFETLNEFPAAPQRLFQMKLSLSPKRVAGRRGWER